MTYRDDRYACCSKQKNANLISLGLKDMTVAEGTIAEGKSLLPDGPVPQLLKEKQKGSESPSLWDCLML